MTEHSLAIHSATYAPRDAEDAYGVMTEHRSMVPDEYDRDEGLKTPVDMAVHHIRDRLYIRGRYAASGGPDWPGPNTWFAQEPYEHPAMDEREEVTVHLAGFTEDEAREVWQRVTAE